MDTEIRKPSDARRRLRVSLYVLVPLAAVAAAYLATRSRPTPSDAEDHSLHGVAGAPAQAVGQPVMLTADQAQRIGVTFAVANVSPLDREIRTVGLVTYDERRVTAISLKLEGWVERLFVNFTGQAVGVGAPLLAIYSPMLVAAQEELLLARRLEADVAAASPDARANAASLLTSARRRLAYWDIPPDDIERIERSGQVQRAITLRSPVSGFVVEKNVLEGQRVMEGEPLYRIANLGTVWVEGEVYERDLASVRLGQNVAVEVEAFAGRALSGRITYVYPTLNTETRTSRVRVELANPGLLLKPGMYATLVWRGTGVLAALSVPRSAVVSTGERNLVFLKRADGMLEPRLVQIGMSTSDRVQILSGLAVGDTVVRSATFLVDAESNLGSILGGMGDMPGMDMSAPTTRDAAPPPASRPDAAMPGMEMPAVKKPGGGADAHTNH